MKKRPGKFYQPGPVVRTELLKLGDQFADNTKLTCAAQVIVLFANKFGVFFHKDLARFAQVKSFGVVAEEFAVNASPNQAAVSVNINFGYPKQGSSFKLGRVNTFGAQDLTASVIDAFNFFLGN